MGWTKDLLCGVHSEGVRSSDCSDFDKVLERGHIELLFRALQVVHAGMPILAMIIIIFVERALVPDGLINGLLNVDGGRIEQWRRTDRLEGVTLATNMG
ncbi:hypothetical protein AcV7_008792 [Taiwanofungus camphoratus]|nr:hypothetical protein AcV7_008792 [Antrodia cinnamomea]